MIYFTTIYQVNNVQYSSFIYAQNRKIANEIIRTRNISERIVGELIKTPDFNPSPLPSDFYLERKLIDCIHTLTFYGWLAARAGVVPFISDVMLRDDGILHEVLHEMHFPEEFTFRDQVFNALMDLEAVIPGLCSWNGEKPRIERGLDRRKIDQTAAVLT